MSNDEQNLTNLPNVSRFNNDFFHFVRGDTLVICSTLDSLYVLDGKFAPKESKCMIFAERVDIRESIRLPGKQLEIHCGRLQIGGSQGAAVRVDLSGDTYPKPGASADSDGGKGKSGMAGGSFKLHTDVFPSKLTSLLTVNVSGGKGGDGGDTAARDKEPGAGGDGGKGGTVQFYMPLSAAAVGHSLLEQRTQNWSERIDGILSSEFQAFWQALGKDSPQDKDAFDSFNTIIARYDSFRTTCQSLISSLRRILRPLQKDVILEGHPDISKQLNTLQQTVEDLLRATLPATTTATPSPTPPTSKPVAAMLNLVDDTVITSLQSFHGECDKYLALKSRSETEVKSLKASVDTIASQIPTLMAVNLESETAPLQTCSLSVFMVCRRIQDDLQSQVKSLSTADGGKRGVGGDGALAASSSGSNGSAGKVGARSCTLLSMRPGDNSVLSCEKTLALPEQCQMLLNKANMTAYAGKRSDAAKLYRRIVDRLFFIGTLGQESTSNTVPLMQAYTVLEIAGITIMPIQRLQAIYRESSGRLSNLNMAGAADMFGRAADFAPRQPYSTYTTVARDALLMLKEMEITCQQIDLETTKAAELQTKIENALASNAKALENAVARQELLEGANGPIATNIYQIVSFQSHFAEKKSRVLEALKQIEKDIDKKFTLTPNMVLDALGTVAFAPHETLLKAVSLAKIIYEGMSEVESGNGQLVRKDYVISQLATTGDSLNKLVETFKARSDQSIDVDDPAAIKLVTSKAQLDAIIKDFHTSVNPKNVKEFTDAFDDYIKVVTDRNSCIIEYNAALQMLKDTRAEVKLYKAEKEHMSASKLQIDPTLPTVGMLMHNTLERVKLYMMDNLSLANRALSYWGPCKLLEFSSEAPIPSHENLERILTVTLPALKSSVVDSYASHAIGKWPSGDKNSYIYQLTPGSIDQLKKTQHVTRLDKTKAAFHKVALPLRSGMSNAFDPGLAFLGGQVNVRINQVYLWLPGAKRHADGQGRQMIQVGINMSGKESIYDTKRREFPFTHEAVDVPWAFYAEDIKTLKDCTSDKRALKQVIDSSWAGDVMQKDADIKAMGPWCTWTFTIQEDLNPGLDLSGVKTAYLELEGWSQSA